MSTTAISKSYNGDESSSSHKDYTTTKTQENKTVNTNSSSSNALDRLRHFLERSLVRGPFCDPFLKSHSFSSKEDAVVLVTDKDVTEEWLLKSDSIDTTTDTHPATLATSGTNNEEDTNHAGTLEMDPKLEDSHQETTKTSVETAEHDQNVPLGTLTTEQLKDDPSSPVMRRSKRSKEDALANPLGDEQSIDDWENEFELPEVSSKGKETPTVSEPMVISSPSSQHHSTVKLRIVKFCILWAVSLVAAVLMHPQSNLLQHQIQNKWNWQLQQIKSALDKVKEFLWVDPKNHHHGACQELFLSENWNGVDEKNHYGCLDMAAEYLFERQQKMSHKIKDVEKRLLEEIKHCKEFFQSSGGGKKSSNKNNQCFLEKARDQVQKRQEWMTFKIQEMEQNYQMEILTCIESSSSSSNKDEENDDSLLTCTNDHAHHQIIIQQQQKWVSKKVQELNGQITKGHYDCKHFFLGTLNTGCTLELAQNQIYKLREWVNQNMDNFDTWLHRESLPCKGDDDDDNNNNDDLSSNHENEHSSKCSLQGLFDELRQQEEWLGSKLEEIEKLYFVVVDDNDDDDDDNWVYYYFQDKDDFSFSQTENAALGTDNDDDKTEEGSNFLNAKPNENLEQPLQSKEYQPEVESERQQEGTLNKNPVEESSQEETSTATNGKDDDKIQEQYDLPNVGRNESLVLPHPSDDREHDLASRLKQIHAEMQVEGCLNENHVKPFNEERSMQKNDEDDDQNKQRSTLVNVEANESWTLPEQNDNHELASKSEQTVASFHTEGGMHEINVDSLEEEGEDVSTNSEGEGDLKLSVTPTDKVPISEHEEISVASEASMGTEDIVSLKYSSPEQNDECELASKSEQVYTNFHHEDGVDEVHVDSLDEEEADISITSSGEEDAKVSLTASEKETMSEHDTLNHEISVASETSMVSEGRVSTEKSPPEQNDDRELASKSEQVVGNSHAEGGMDEINIDSREEDEEEDISTTFAGEGDFDPVIMSEHDILHEEKSVASETPVDTQGSVSSEYSSPEQNDDRELASKSEQLLASFHLEVGVDDVNVDSLEEAEEGTSTISACEGDLKVSLTATETEPISEHDTLNHEVSVASEKSMATEGIVATEHQNDNSEFASKLEHDDANFHSEVGMDEIHVDSLEAEDEAILTISAGEGELKMSVKATENLTTPEQNSLNQDISVGKDTPMDGDGSISTENSQLLSAPLSLNDDDAVEGVVADVVKDVADSDESNNLEPSVDSTKVPVAKEMSDHKSCHPDEISLCSEELNVDIKNEKVLHSNPYASFDEVDKGKEASNDDSSVDIDFGEKKDDCRESSSQIAIDDSDNTEENTSGTIEMFRLEHDGSSGEPYLVRFHQKVQAGEK